jgi:tetratricopeptide (TPR) repeat protein
MTMRTTCTLLCAALLLSAGYPRGALAQPKTSVAVQVGELFDQAQAAFAKGDKQGAYDAYKAAWALQKSFDIAGNLGNVEVKLGKYRDAAEHLAFALESFPPTGEEAQQKAMEKKLAEVLKEVGRLHVQLSANGARVDGASVTVNGSPAGSTPLPGTLFVEPGSVVVEVKLSGYLDGRQQVTIAKGGEQSVTLSLVPLPSPRRSVVPGVVLGGVAVAALAGGIGSFVAARGKRSTAQSLSQSILEAQHSCYVGASNFDARCDQVSSAASSGNTLEHVATGLFVGAGAAAVGAVVYFVWPQASPTPPKSGAWQIAPALSPSALGLSASGTF